MTYSKFIKLFSKKMIDHAEKLNKNYEIEITGVKKKDVNYSLISLKQDKKYATNSINLIIPYLLTKGCNNMDLVAKETMQILCEEKKEYSNNIVASVYPDLIYENVFCSEGEQTNEWIGFIGGNEVFYRLFFMFEGDFDEDIPDSQRAKDSPISWDFIFYLFFDVKELVRHAISNTDKLSKIAEKY